MLTIENVDYIEDKKLSLNLVAITDFGNPLARNITHSYFLHRLMNGRHMAVRIASRH